MSSAVLSAASAPRSPCLPGRLALHTYYFLTNLTLAAALTAAAWWVDTRPENAHIVRLLQMHILGCVAVTWPLHMIYAHWLMGPIGRISNALREGKDPADLDPEVVRQMLTLYRPLSWAVLVSWGASSVAWPVVAGIAYGAEAARGALPSGVAGIGAAVIVSRCVHSVFYLLTRYHIAPVLLPGGSIEHLRPVRVEKVWTFIMNIVLVLGVVNPTYAVILAVQGAATPGLIAYLAVLLLAVTGLQIFVALGAISRGAGHLAGRMEEVREGRLDVQAQVRSLDTLGQLASDFNAMVAGLRQRELMRETFGRYVSRQIAEEILAGRVALGGEERTATVLFSDIRGFTKMSERMSPREVVSFLNRYLDVMVDRVFAHGGVPDKFIGDAVMALWGVPVGDDVAAGARAAARCAVDMSAALDALNREREEAGLEPIEIGIGLHTGPLVAGNIGSQRFMQYTVIGDTVNLTSRIEGMSKTLGRRIVMSAATAELVAGEMELRRLDEMPVRGREAPVQVFGLA